MFLCLFLLQSQATVAFVAPSTTCSVENGRSMGCVKCNEYQKHMQFRREKLTRRLAGLDDEYEDDEDEVDEKGPLANGIDSVSWLPSVDGAKGDNMPIESVKEVRFSDRICDQTVL